MTVDSALGRFTVPALVVLPCEVAVLVTDVECHAIDLMTADPAEEGGGPRQDSATQPLSSVAG
jgi:hypothetical protein